MTKEYHKLVRDKIPNIIRESEHTPHTHTATGYELETALWEKLDEEVNEFRKSKDVNEFADVLEVVYALANFYGVEPGKLEKTRQEKHQERGGFHLGIILEKVE